jgi:hypothetical protein
MPLEHEETSRYRAYVLRMWCVNACAWRFSLVDAETGEKRGFADLAGLVAFLQEEMERGVAERAPSNPAGK